MPSELKRGGMRRSGRVRTIDLNGRGYLSDQLGWSVEELEYWLRSEHVHYILKDWHTQSVDDPISYNCVLQLINNGVFEVRQNKFEEELLLASIGEYSLYGEAQDAMSKMMDCWAHSVRRIVQASVGHFYIFTHLYRHHTARIHAITIDLLCIAFHSLAHRGDQSCWHALICGQSSTGLSQLSSTTEPTDLCDDAKSTDGADSAIGGIDLEATEADGSH